MLKNITRSRYLLNKWCWLVLTLVILLSGVCTARAEQYGSLSIPAKKASKNSSIELRLSIYNDTALLCFAWPRPTEAQLREMVDEMHAQQMDTIVIAYQDGCGYGVDYANGTVTYDPLVTIPQLSS